MPDLLPLGALVLTAVAAYQLWTAYSRGEVRGRFGAVYVRSQHPIAFWSVVTGSLLLLVGSMVVLAQALVPGLHRPAPRPQTATERRGAAYSTYYPDRAQRAGISGAVVVRCRVTDTFGLADCAVESEQPPGYGFGQAALKIAATTILPTKDKENVSPGQVVRFPVRFKLPANGGARW
ncbi:MAG: TonB family protein [Phenylobacterium sp.]|nr:MAG: TonB family protein [Phenylobacterium sp.]